MNALADNAFTRSLARLAEEIPKPRAILCVSAHWMTEGTWITHMPRPKTIHDFYGFPRELFDVQYPAPGHSEIAEEIQSHFNQDGSRSKIQLDDEFWGLDHGTWSVLRPMYPLADVPVMQLSLNMAQPGEYHLELGSQLRFLRERGILIVGSGNIVHNLRRIHFEEDAPPYDWAVEFDAWVKDRLIQKDYGSLVSGIERAPNGKLSVPTFDHWYPLLYVLGASEPSDQLRFFYEGIENSSISMRSFLLAET